MAQPDATNAHLHKLLSHRNYMHHVSLQKQLNVYDKQKKLVEKELQEIIKVREAIQQIKRNLPKKSPNIKKRDESRKKSKSYESLLIKSGVTVKKKKELTRQEVEDANLNSEEVSNNGDQLKLFETRKKSKSHPSLLMKSEKIVKEMKEHKQQEKVVKDVFVNGKETQTNISEVNLFGPKDEIGVATAIQSLPTQRTRSGVHASRRILPKQEPCEDSSSEVIKKTNTESITAASMDRQIQEKLSKAEANGDSLNLNNGNMTEEGERRLRKQCTPNIGNKKLFTRGRPPYIKSSSAPSIHVQKPEEIMESEGKVTERGEIYQLTKGPRRMFNENRYSNSDDNLYKKTLLENHLNEGAKLPVLSDRKHNIGVPAENTNKDENVLPAEKKRFVTSSPVLGAFSNSDFCLVERSRPRPGTVCDLQTTKPQFPSNLKHAQEKFTKSAQIKSTFPNDDVCLVQPRARSRTVCKNYQPAKYGRARSKTVSFHPGNQQRSEWPAKLENDKNKSESAELFTLSKDETIAIKGKFKQIGHSVLAIALMKKMAGNK